MQQAASCRAHSGRMEEHLVTQHHQLVAFLLRAEGICHLQEHRNHAYRIH
jgi:hypothetical protein